MSYKARLAGKSCEQLAKAIRQFRLGNPSALAHFVRHDALEPEQRHRLAEFLTSLKNKPKPSGRPIDDKLVHKAAEETQSFLRWWHEENVRHRVNDNRKQKGMRNQAAAIVAGKLGIPDKAERVCKLVDEWERSAHKNRRVTEHTGISVWDW
jgi:hypothetical protein